MVQLSKRPDEKLSEHILNFCRHVAGSCRVTAACLCGDYALGLSDVKTLTEVLLIIRDFQPRLMNYVKVFDKRNIIVYAVDEWVFERDVERGFLGEALAGGLIFPYIALENGNYLHCQEVKLKKRLILELMRNLVLNFPEFSYELQIKPEYFVYETMLSRARLFPPTIYNVMNFLREGARERNVQHALDDYLQVLKELERESLVVFSNGYVKVSRKFVDNVRSQKIRFMSLLKSAQRTLFTSVLSVFPKIMRVLSENREISVRLQRLSVNSSNIVRQIEDPQRYLYVPTANGLIPMANRMDIETFARKMLSASQKTEVKIEEIGGVLNDVYLIRASLKEGERKIIVKSFRDWSSFKWFPLTLWTVGTRTFAVSGLSRLERECAINQLLFSKGFAVPKVLHVSPSERLVFMEYVEGENLEKVIKKISGSKSRSEVENELRIINRVGEKFAEVHALDIALGDTKPENIMVGKNREIFMLDFEQAARNGDKVWDVAEFLYYAGHYIPPLIGTRPVGTRPAELIAKAFVEGYLKAGGSVKVVKKAGNPKYTKVFSIFTFPHIMLAISNTCRKADKLKE